VSQNAILSTPKWVESEQNLKKLSEEVVRFNCRLPKAVADWIGSKAKEHGVTLSEELRHMIMDQKSAEDFIKTVSADVVQSALRRNPKLV
jgi:DNA polymerase III delta subunit